MADRDLQGDAVHVQPLSGQDAANPEDFTQSFLHRSTDGGRTWQRITIEVRDEERCGVPRDKVPGASTSRNVVEMDDDTLLFGVSLGHSGVGYLWRSTDEGATWDHGEAISIADYRGKPYDNADGFFAEDFTYLTCHGILLHWIRCGPPSSMYPLGDGASLQRPTIRATGPCCVNPPMAVALGSTCVTSATTA